MTKKGVENLKPNKKGDITSEQAKKMGHNGGVASGIARREKKIFRDAILKRLNAKTISEIIDGVISRAKTSDIGFVTMRDTIGEKPTDTIDATVSGVNIVVASKKDKDLINKIKV
jgi:predicted Fe-Mo cluster-binding NifX family protein